MRSKTVPAGATRLSAALVAVLATLALLAASAAVVVGPAATARADDRSQHDSRAQHASQPAFPPASQHDDRSPNGGRHPRAAHWTAAWAAAVHHPFTLPEWFGPNWSEEGFADQTVRQVVRVTTGGAQVRVRLSNRFGTAPLRVTGVTVARAGDGAAVRPGTLRPVTFGGRTSTTLPVGSDRVSDPVRLPTRALQPLAVTMYFARPTGATTFHEGGLTTTYRAAGDHRFANAAGPFGGETTHSYYLLTGVDVTRGPGRQTGTVVAFGDSITDGAFSTANADNRYPDELAERLVAAGRRLGVVNLGINGNKVLGDSTCFGERGVGRFGRDALGQPGVRTVIVLEGINDIGSGGLPDTGCGTAPKVTAGQIIAGHRAMIAAAHSRGVRILGATLTPVKGNEYGYDTPENERIRDEVNRWIRTSGEYDGVVDFDRAVADPNDPDAFLPAYDGGDHLHPNDAGMRAMAEAIDLADL
ncbi:SGNH/GDSL hydrolase family protein [Actinopolymorpha singaporensis]|uniref:Lysophospholipase L1 n=1 Tax=Actinopolymorpha singaporensis TaxID=117157 RepID=A0A1H1NXY5_9ACTN|nr:SGNH/GDSL hydrolase family protein [Actinopolymorpha singaporensis]SDS03838.1 Lysophospholipase L1 [Actinopolymorpha singaporensis]